MATQQFMFNATYNLPDRDIGFVIGTKGNKIQAIQRETGATVKLVKVPPNTGLMSHFHITSFSQDSVNAAWAALHNAATLAMQLNTGTIERKNQERFPSTTSAWSRSSAVTLHRAQGRAYIRRVHREDGTRSRCGPQGKRYIRIVAKTEIFSSSVWLLPRNFPRLLGLQQAGRLARRAPSRLRGPSRLYVQDLKEGKMVPQ